MASRPTGSAATAPAGASRTSASNSTTVTRSMSVERGGQLPVRDHNLGAAVREDNVELAGGEPGVEGDRDGAQLERAQEGGGEADTVMA